MHQDEINELQRNLADAVGDKLPPGWTFLLCAIAPDGQRYFSGSVQASPLGKQFIRDLEQAMDVQVWRIPPKRPPTKVTTPKAEPHRPPRPWSNTGALTYWDNHDHFQHHCDRP